MLEQLLHFKSVFNNPTIYIIECISWRIKYLSVKDTSYRESVSFDLVLLYVLKHYFSNVH